MQRQKNEEDRQIAYQYLENPSKTKGDCVLVLVVVLFRVHAQYCMFHSFYPGERLLL